MGFLAKGTTGEEISDLLEKLICNKILLSDVSRYNYIFAKENFMASTVADKLKQTYQGMVEK